MTSVGKGGEGFLKFVTYSRILKIRPSVVYVKYRHLILEQRQVNLLKKSAST